MTVEILRVRANNAATLSCIEPGVFDNPIDPEQLEAFLDDPRHILVVAFVDGTVVGMATAVEYFHPDKMPQLWINEVGVAENHRRRGIGHALMQALLAEGRARGCAAAWLGTDVDNKAAHACFMSVAPLASKPFLMFEWELN